VNVSESTSKKVTYKSLLNSGKGVKVSGYTALKMNSAPTMFVTVCVAPLKQFADAVFMVEPAPQVDGGTEMPKHMKPAWVMTA